MYEELTDSLVCGSFIHCMCFMPISAQAGSVCVYFRLILSVVCNCWYCLLIPACNKFRKKKTPTYIFVRISMSDM